MSGEGDADAAQPPPVPRRPDLPYLRRDERGGRRLDYRIKPLDPEKAGFIGPAHSQTRNAISPLFVHRFQLIQDFLL